MFLPWVGPGLDGQKMEALAGWTQASPPFFPGDRGEGTRPAGGLVHQCWLGGPGRSLCHCSVGAAFSVSHFLVSLDSAQSGHRGGSGLGAESGSWDTSLLTISSPQIWLACMWGMPVILTLLFTSAKALGFHHKHRSPQRRVTYTHCLRQASRLLRAWP